MVDKRILIKVVVDNRIVEDYLIKGFSIDKVSSLFDEINFIPYSKTWPVSLGESLDDDFEAIVPGYFKWKKEPIVLIDRYKCHTLEGAQYRDIKMIIIDPEANRAKMDIKISGSAGVGKKFIANLIADRFWGPGWEPFVNGKPHDINGECYVIKKWDRVRRELNIITEDVHQEGSRILTWREVKFHGDNHGQPSSIYWEADSEQKDNFEIHLEKEGYFTLDEGGDWLGYYPTLEITKGVAQYLANKRI